MKGLILKDFYLIKTQSKFLLVFALVYGALCLSGTMEPSFVSGLALMLTVSLSVSTFSYDDLAHWEKYAAATPAGRRGVVQEKYLFTLLMVLGITAVTALFNVVYSAVRRDFAQLPANLVATAICVVAGLLIATVLLPLLFKFGAEKSRMMMLLGLAVVAVGVFALFGLEQAGLLPESVPTWVIAALPVILLGIVAVAFIVSYSISLKIYAKKEL
ncbi:MAG: ABC-2 transporter permease [Oscillospiraceae bacterium]